MEPSRAQNLLVIGDGLRAAALVYALAQTGARVLWASAPHDSTRPLLRAALDEAGLWDRVAALDLERRDEAALDALFEQATQKLDRLDAVLSLHELRAEPAAPGLHELSLDSWRRSMEQGLRAPFLVARRALMEFLSSGGGRLVQLVVTDQDAAAATVHGALSAFTRSLAREYARRNVTCNAIQLRRAPHPPGEPSALRFCELLEASRAPLSQTALFLSSERASFVNGECLVVEENAP